MIKGLKILVVEDDEILLEQITGALEDEGYNISACSSAEESIERLKHIQPSLVITDLRLPGDDGLSVIKYVKKNIVS